MPLLPFVVKSFSEPNILLATESTNSTKKYREGFCFPSLRRCVSARGIIYLSQSTRRSRREEQDRVQDEPDSDSDPDPDTLFGKACLRYRYSISHRKHKQHKNPPGRTAVFACVLFSGNGNDGRRGRGTPCGFLRRELEHKGVIPVSQGTPEQDGRQVFHRDLDGQTPVPRPHPVAQDLHGLPADPLAPVFADDEEMPQVDFRDGLPVERVGDGFPAVFKDDRLAVTVQAFPHPVAQVREGHGVFLSLFTDELKIPVGEKVEITLCREPVFHVCVSLSVPGGGRNRTRPCTKYLHSVPG